MLTMRVYSERIVNMNGIKTRAGEDALPFVNASGMFVADGMGGSAGIRVSEFHPDCFQTAMLQKRLGDYFIMSQYGDRELSDAFENYVGENFSSLTDETMTRLYQEPQKNNSRLKKSGYVGSHALGTALAGELILLDGQRRSGKFAEKKDWNNKVMKIKDGLVQKYKDIIRILGAQCAKSNINGIDYFGTTLSAAFFYENKIGKTTESVDVIFLNCGDSRCYVWDRDGFRQAADDQGRNGGMTSRFSLTETLDEKDICISVEVRTYKTPCVLYCMTDGIFGSFVGEDGSHSSPLLMEGNLLKRLSSSDSKEEAERKIKELFDRSGQIDDSNSMVIAAFGIEKYDGLRQLANLRLEDLYKKYDLNSLPDNFLVANYEKKTALDLRAISELLDKAYRTTPSVRAYCSQQIKKPEFQGVYGGAIAQLEAKMQEQMDEREQWRKVLRQLVEQNLLAFNPPVIASMEIQKAYKAATDYETSVQQRSDFMKLLQNAPDVLLRQATAFCSLSVFDSDRTEWTTKRAEQCRTLREDIRKNANDACSSIFQALKVLETKETEMAQNLEAWQRRNREIAQQLASFGNYLDTLITGWIDPESKDIPKLARPFKVAAPITANIVKLTEKCREIGREMKKLSKDIEEESERQAYNYWCSYKAQDIGALLRTDAVFSDNPEMKQKILKHFRQTRELEQNRKLLEKQKEVFQDYLSACLRDVSEDQRRDAERNGWM